SQFYDYRNFTISMKCTDATSMNLQKGFESNMVQVYNNPGILSLAGNKVVDLKLEKGYNWDTTKNLLIELCYSNNDNVDIQCANNGGNAPLMKYGRTNFVSTLSYSPKVFYAGGTGGIP